MARKKTRINLAQTARPQSNELDKLFSSEDVAKRASDLQLLSLRVDAIEPDPDQPRRTFVDDSLIELSESIRQDGVIQPIEVTENGPDQYVIVHGERRWRAAKLAGLENIPAIVRQQDYDGITRFVRQLVENIQREDLNDVDRAAGLLHLRDLMKDELAAAKEEDIVSDQPWGNKVTWAKVAGRLGYSRQRIHQLIQLLKLPDEIKEAVRTSALTERDTRVYQGLTFAHQKALYQARMNGELSPAETRQAARFLKQSPAQSVPDVIRILQNPAPTKVEQEFDSSFDKGSKSEPSPEVIQASSDGRAADNLSTTQLDSSIIPPRRGRPSSIDRLDWVRDQLARVKRRGLSAGDRQEVLRLLSLIQQDVSSLIDALDAD